MNRLVRWFVIAVASWLLAFVASAVSVQAVPVFEPGDCPVRFASHADVRCGMVVVPQDRAHSDEPDVRLAVAVFAATSPNPSPDPLIFLDGGPGGRTLDSYTGGLGDFMRRVNRQRDLILFDYRGMGYSEPALTCPESLDPANTDWVTTCHDRFAAQGVDVTDFTTRDNAADAADIVRALGYETYNIWGGSYGSSVAMTLLRDHPENIRAAIVTALQPPQGDLSSAIPVYFQRTLDAIAALCDEDAACRAAFPEGLVDSVAVVVERLNAEPLPVVVHGVDVVVTGYELIAGLSQLMKDDQNIPIIPGFIGALYAEQYEVVEVYATRLTPLPDPLNPIGAYFSMRCTDSILAVTPEDFSAALQEIRPVFRAAFQRRLDNEITQCTAWGARVPTLEDRLPAVSDVPTLIVSGALDPFSSQEWLDSTLATLPNGHGLMLPYHLHYVTQNPCAARLLTGFIEDPTTAPDMSCAERVRPPDGFQLP